MLGAAPLPTAQSTGVGQGVGAAPGVGAALAELPAVAPAVPLQGQEGGMAVPAVVPGVVGGLLLMGSLGILRQEGEVSAGKARRRWRGR